MGRLLNNSIRRFERRVLELMTEAGHHDARISHINLTRNLDQCGTRLTELAVRAGMTKQAMAELIDQCEETSLVEKISDPTDRRAKIVRFTRTGLEWLDAFRTAVDAAEREMRDEVGEKCHADLRVALGSYGSSSDAFK